MTGDRRTRRGAGSGQVRTAIVDLVDGIEVPPAPGAHAPRRAPRSRRPALVVAAAIAVVLLLLVAVFAPRAAAPPVPAGSSTLVPRELPGYRMWRTPQSWSPLSRVAMAWRFPQDEDFPPLDLSHEMLLGADLETQRHLDGAPQPVAVSPDGRRLAYAVDDEGVLRLDDLATRRSVTVRLPGAGPIAGPSGIHVVPLAWSADGQRFYVRTSGRATVWEVTPEGGLARVPAAEAAPRADDENGESLRASPDGIHLTMFGFESDVQVVDRRAPARPSANPLAGLRGIPVWTPSGASLVVVSIDVPADEPSSVTIVDAATMQRRTLPDRVACTPIVMLTERRLLCEAPAATEPNVPSDEAPRGLVTLDLETGEQRVVALGESLADLDVADDLARTWRFSMNDPWYPTVPERE